MTPDQLSDEKEKIGLLWFILAALLGNSEYDPGFAIVGWVLGSWNMIHAICITTAEIARKRKERREKAQDHFPC